MKFSEKIGKTSVKLELQTDGISTTLENRLWATIVRDCFDQTQDIFYSNGHHSPNFTILSKDIWIDFFGMPLDELPLSLYNNNLANRRQIISYTKRWFHNDAKWYEKYDFIEFLAITLGRINNRKFISNCNKFLKKEASAYRIIKHEIIRIINEDEIQEIEQTLNLNDKFALVKTHIRTASRHLSDRKDPDYRNSIKESISAIESLFAILTGNRKLGFTKSLNEVEKKHDLQLHPALKEAYSKLYGYTSDAGGIRHSLVDNDTDLKYEDAKFMLISCSAFINYLTKKVEK